MAEADHVAADLTVGLGGLKHNACVAVCGPDRVLGVCGQERVTRVRAAGVNATGLPDEALDEVLHRAGRSRSDVGVYVASEEPGRVSVDLRPIDHHFAHACSAFLPSPFESAVVIVCDHDAPQVSVWQADGTMVTRSEWPWNGTGFAEFYSQCAMTLGFESAGREQRMEALARFGGPPDPVVDDRTRALARLESDHLALAREWQARVRELDIRSLDKKATAANALQSHVGDLIVDFVGRVRRQLPERNRLCLGGSFFYNSYINSRIKRSGIFEEVFVPIDPGNAGLALGAALHASPQPRPAVSPFLGPAYSSEEIKTTLENCKLTYNCVPEREVLDIAVQALSKGRLVAWFDGGMEWGPRALGARSIFANPFAPYALENLNQYLKHRDPWRGYALSGTAEAVREHMTGPSDSAYMECDFEVLDRQRFRHVLPGPGNSVRAHTVDSKSPSKLTTLLEAFGAASGLPILVNTSFNGFREPIVCSPRDAVRVFFGTGIDVLILGQFVLVK